MLKRKNNVRINEANEKIHEYNDYDNNNCIEENKNPLLGDNLKLNSQQADNNFEMYHSNYVDLPPYKIIVQNDEYNAETINDNTENESMIENKQIMKLNENKTSQKTKRGSLKKRVLKTKSIIKLNKKKEQKMKDDMMAFSAMQQSTRQSIIVRKNSSIMSKSSKCMNEFYTVELRAVFLKIGDIDTLNEKFYAEAFIEAKWYDPNLSPDKEYDAEKNWNPKVYILNCLGDIKQDTWYHQYSVQEYEQEEHENKFNDINSSVIKNLNIIKTTNSIDPINKNINSVTFSDSNGSIIVERRKVKSQFWQTLDLKNFPCDIQQLTITLTSPTPSSEIQLKHCKLKASSVNVKAFADSQEWLLYKHISVNESLRDSVFSSETYPILDLTITAARRPTFYYWNAFFLIFLITLTSLSIFSIKCHLTQARIQTTSTLLLTSVTFKWITNRSLPTVSYMTSLDKYSISCMIFICAQCIWHSTISVMMDVDGKCENPFSFYDWISFSCFCTIFVLIHFIFFCWLIRIGYSKRSKLNKQELDYTNSIIGKRSTRLKSMLYGI